ncbi:MAG TPA: chemotaxis response regulator protein-glutamate methylesterase [Xanthobacteraceae bacterium]|jgi:two-component system chemotaxis response regulator CheB
MVVDDAVVFRGLVARWLGEEPDMEIVGSHRNGYEALENFLRVDPDVVVLDIQMPGIDGLETLPLLLEKKPDVTVIISSTVTRRNAEVGIRALSLGAKDYLSKPETNREMTMSPDFRRDLVQKIRELGRRGLRKLLRTQVPEPAAPAPSFSLRPYSTFSPRVLVIGASTGGPQALQVLMRGLDPVLRRLPVLVTQHMPPTFTTILAEHLGRTIARPAHEGLHGETVSAGTLYVAPGGRHMQIERKGEQARIVIDDGPPVNFCRPSVDPLFTSAAATYGVGTLAVVLTGMGADGAAGAERVAAAGGSVIAQDEATSVVWGMPGAAAEAGVCSGVLALEAIAPKVIELVTGGAPAAPKAPTTPEAAR